MRLTQLALLSTGLCFALFACRGGGDDSGDDTMMPDGPPGGVVKVKDVQNDAMPSGTSVELRGVIVTAIDTFGARTGDLWVQDAEGGAFSGIKVFGAPLDVIATLQAGDIVDISNAVKDEFKCMPPTCSTPDEGSITEIKGVSAGALTITKKGTGTVPTPEIVDAKAIGAMTKEERVAEWEKWEGVLVKVINARQLAAARTFSDGNADQHEFRITGIARVQSVLADLNTDEAFGVCYESITGIGDHFFNDLILPRSTADIVTGGTSCNPFATDITQARTTPNTELAQLTEVFVSAISFNNKHLWLTTSLTAAPNEGVYVYRGGGATVLPADVVVGAKVTVTGAVDEFNNDATGTTLTEIVDPTITVVAAPTAAPIPVTGQTAASLIAAGTGEPYESVLVTLTGVKVNDVGTSPNFTGELQQGTTTFVSDDDILRLQAADVGKCFTITGLWTYQVYSDAYGLLPITKVETPGVCN